MPAIAGILAPGIDSFDVDRLALGLQRRDARAFDSIVVPGVLLCARGGSLGSSDGHTVVIDGEVRNLDELLHRYALTAANGEHALGLARLLGHAPDALAELQGEFAFAWHDAHSGSLTLVRDRFGTRPLLYARADRGWIWASESHVLLPFVGRIEVDPAAIAETTHYRWLVGDRKLLTAVQQVLPSHIVRLAHGAPATSTRWHLYRLQPQFDTPIEVWAQRIDDALDSVFAEQARRHRHVAVPLSGGVDSSLLLAKARQHFTSVSAWSLRIAAFDNPELERAERVAQVLGVPLHIVELQPADVARNYTRLIERLEETPRHASSIALLQLLDAISADGAAALVLYGLGADSLFGFADASEYQRYCTYRRMAERLPPMLRMLIAAALPIRVSPRLRGLAHVLRIDAATELRALLAVEYRCHPQTVLRHVPLRAAPNAASDLAFHGHSDDPHAQIEEHDMYLDLTNLAECVDRFSAAHEYRLVCPFLYAEITDVAHAMPPSSKHIGDLHKPALKAVACRYLPREIVYASKQGFPVPLRGWLEGPLAPFVESFGAHTPVRAFHQPDAVAKTMAAKDPALLWTMMGLEFAVRSLLGEAHSITPRSQAAERPL